MHPSGLPVSLLGARSRRALGAPGVNTGVRGSYLRGRAALRPGQRGECAGEGSPVGLNWRGLAAFAEAGGGGEREGTWEGEGGRGRERREAQPLSQALRAGRAAGSAPPAPGPPWRRLACLPLQPIASHTPRDPKAKQGIFEMLPASGTIPEILGRGNF